MQQEKPATESQSPAADQTEDPTDSTEKDSRQEFERLKAQIAAAQIDESQQKIANASLAIVESNLKRQTSNKQQTQTNIELTKTAAERTASERQALKTLGETKKRTIPNDSDLSEMQRELTDQINQAQAELKSIQSTMANRREQSKNQSATIASLNSQLVELEKRLAETAPLSENALVAEARDLELRTSAEFIAAEIERLNSEAALFEAEEKSGYLVAKNEFWTAKEKRLKELADTLSVRIEQQRKNDTQLSVRNAKEAVDKAPAVLKEFAEENARIAEMATAVLEPLQKSKSDLRTEKMELDQLRKKFTSTENRVKAVGLTASVGAYLRNRKSEIPREGWLNPILGDRLSEIEKYQSQQFDLEEFVQTLNTDEVITTTLGLAGSLDEPEKNSLIADTTSLVNKRRELLSQALENHEDYVKTLEELQTTETELSELLANFHEYINERILWIRSNDLLFSKLATDESESKILKPQNWILAAQNCLADFRKHVVGYVAIAAAFLIFFSYRRRMRQAVTKNSQIVLRGTNTAIWPTLETTFLTVAISLPIALLLVVLGLRLANIDDGSDLTIAIGRSLIPAGWFLFLGELLRQICRKHGLAEGHFRWPESTLTKLNSELAWFVPVGSIASFVCGLLYLIDINHEVDTFERLASIIAIGLFAAFLYRVGHPQFGMFREQVAAYPKSWLVQSRNFWFWLLLAVPTALILMVVVGYYYSAIQVVNRLFSTVVAIVGLEIFRSLILKFVQLSRRRAKIDQSRARLAAQSSIENSESTKSSTAVELERAADVETFLASEKAVMDENFDRSRKLISAGIAASWVFAILLIWADVFPALKGLDRYVFWTTTIDQVVAQNDSNNILIMSPTGGPTLTSNESTAESSSESVAESAATSDSDSSTNLASSVLDSGEIVRQVKQPVTLRNFLVAMFILAVAIFAVRNLPAFLELVFLKHLPLEQSLRHAIRAILGYLILMVGIFASGRAMYIGWGQIQWLATALTFGLAFGLQEIFANFIAGIILLLERPLRIGDIVQVDDVSGVVTKIRIRATTIRNFDQKEFVIPNKEFITGRLLNWTLADKIVRQTLRVGIAYGSDVRQAKQIIKKICDDHANVLDEQRTVVTFEEFGDSSLNLSARIYLKDFDTWWSTMDSINLAIDDAFKAAGIEISFPQRDLHLRTVAPDIEKALVDDRTKGEFYSAEKSRNV